MGKVKTVGIITTIVVALATTPVFAQPVSPPLPGAAPRDGGALGPYTAPACVPGVPFSDITCTTTFDAWIEQFARDGITGGCGGGLYCPGTAVTRDQMAVFVERAMRGTGNWPPHTQLVWAIKASDGSPDQVASGTALLNAVTAIPSSGNDAPSGSNPWLLKVGPGIFNLNGAGLSLPAYVNLDGAGQNSTTITSSNDTWYTVFSSSANTISNVTVTNWGTGNYTYAIYANGSGLTLDHVFVEAIGGAITSVGVLLNNSALYLSDGGIVSGAEGIFTLGTQYHSVQAARTLFSCSSDVYNAAGYEIDLAYTRVPDALNNFGAGVFKCIGNYDFNLAPVTCP